MNTTRPFSRLRPGDQSVSAGNINRALDELEAAAAMSGLRSFGGPNPGAQPPQAETFYLWVRITSGAHPYAWEEVYYDDQQAGSEWQKILDDDGQTAANFGTADPDESIPAYEILNNPGVAAGTIVRAWVHESGTRLLFRHVANVGAGGVYINASQVTEDQNALAVAIDYTTILYDFSDAHTINGFANGYPGRIVKVTNTSGFPQTITNQSPSALTADRVTTPNGADILWGAGATIDLLWDEVLGNWRVIGWTPPPGTGSSIEVSTTTGGVQLVNDTPAPGNNYYYGTGPTGTRGWFPVGGAGMMQWVGYTILYTDFTDADTNQVLTLRTLTAYEMIHGAICRNSVAFTAPGLSTANIKIGPDDNDALFVSGHDLQTLNNWATNGTVGVSNLLNEHDYNRNSLHSTKAVILTLDTTGANVNQFTAGALQVWLLVSTLPT